MKIKLINLANGDAFLPLPEDLLKQLGWAVGDELQIELPTLYPDQIIIHKPDTPHCVYLGKVGVE